MKTVRIELPDSVEVDDREARTILAAQLYRCGRLSLGLAAEVARLSKRTFTEIRGRYEVSVFNEDIDELETDLHNA